MWREGGCARSRHSYKHTIPVAWYGTAGDDTLTGDGGIDYIEGLEGGAGDNVLYGGPGDDELEGYSSKVIIEFYFDVSAGFGTDTIDGYDYSASQETRDRIYLCGDANTIEFQRLDRGLGDDFAYRIQVTNNGVKAGEIRQQHPHSGRTDVHISTVPATTLGCTP